MKNDVKKIETITGEMVINDLVYRLMQYEYDRLIHDIDYGEYDDIETVMKKAYFSKRILMDIICGKFFVCDCTTDRFKSLPPDMMDKYKKMFYYPERFVRFNGEIAAVKYDPDKEAAR